MKRFYLAAGALLLGSSAFAWAAGDSTGKEAAGPSAATATKSVDASKTGEAVSKAAWWSDLDAKLAAAGITEKASLTAKSIADKSAATTASDDPAVQAKLAAVQGKDAAAVETKLAMADPSQQTGMGGPLEEGGQATTAELTPRPATMNYPPCDPGPGDDRCIQLYEPGVRAQLAAWNEPTGGLLDHQATTAMGGPYEPVADDGKVEMASSDTDAADHATANIGVGGPVEAQSGYPPCDPGPGDDRCIQLYEPGVTGAGN